MKFNRATLRKAVDDAIAAQMVEHVEYQQKRAATYAAELERWTGRHAENWNAAATTIKRKIRAGKPITKDDVPVTRDGYRDVALFRSSVGDGAAPVREDYRVRGDLQVIANVLDMLEDEEVTDSALGRLGVKSNMIRNLAAAIPVAVKP